MTQSTSSNDDPGIDQLSLAVERTLLAYERTLMAWIRTAASLITFGFTLYKFSQYMHGDEPAGASQHLIGPRGYGMVFIAFGVITLTLASWQNRSEVRRLRAHDAAAPFPLALLLSALIAVFGFVALVVAAFRR